MEIKLLGTGAADGIPAFFGESRVGEYARAYGGKDIRTRSAAIIDGHIKIDLGPDTFSQMITHGTRPSDWSGIFFTHSHDDHLCESELQYTLAPFTEEEFSPFTVYGNDAVLARIQARFPDWPFELVLTKSFESFDHQGYLVTPIQAFHRLEEDCHNFIFEFGGKAFLYAADTGYWREPTWEFLSDKKLDGVVFECTDGFKRSSYHGHMDAKEVVDATNRLVSMGCLLPGASVTTTHHGQAGDATHAELEAFLVPNGIQVGFDGVSIKL
ncbi:MAG: hypothetical protein JNK63_06400 [Chthonomonas sp.]|nr:hypothetical protein [Chthonomonas sp.]